VFRIPGSIFSEKKEWEASFTMDSSGKIGRAFQDFKKFSIDSFHKLSIERSIPLNLPTT